jgi:Flp pilus assembly protein TadD
VAWSQKGKPDNAIKDYTEAIRLDPKDANAYNNRGIVWTSKGEFGNAIKDYTEAIRLDPQYASAHNGLAWLLATCPNEKYRNGKQAVADATKACEFTHWKNSSFCDTLAVAYAELGDFAAAVKWQTKAIELVASDPASVQEYRDRLELYRQHKPFREPSREGGEKKKEMEAKTVQPPL